VDRQPGNPHNHQEYRSTEQTLSSHGFELHDSSPDECGAAPYQNQCRGRVPCNDPADCWGDD
jgi:hypothetical protein